MFTQLTVYRITHLIALNFQLTANDWSGIFSYRILFIEGLMAFTWLFLTHEGHAKIWHIIPPSGARESRILENDPFP